MSKKTEGTVFAVFVVVSVVGTALPIALAAYLAGLECPRYSGEGDPSFAGLSAMRGTDNWTVTLVAGLRGMYPDTTLVEIRDGQHRVLFERRPWSSLTRDRWLVNLMVSVDNHPSVPPVCEGDQLLVDVQAYPDGSILVIWRGDHPVGWATLI